MKILIISINDISNNDISSIKNELTKLGNEVIIETVTTDNTIEQLSKKETNIFDYIFVEFDYSERSHIDFLEMASSIFYHVPIIAIVNEKNLEFIQDMLQCGITDFITKPFSSEEFTGRLAVITKNRRKIKALKTKQEELKMLIEQHGIANLALQDEIKLAKYVQKSVLGTPFEDRNIKIDARYVPSKELSGDMYCWHKIEDGIYGIMLLDVMGHGVSSALVGMSIRSLLRGVIMRLVDPIKVISELNNHMNNLFLENDEMISYYFSAIYVLIDTHKKKVEYVNAGNPPALAMTDEVFQMKEGSIAVGLMPNMRISKGSFSYDSSLRMLLYTDGILDFAGEKPSIGIKNMEEYFKRFNSTHGENIMDNLIAELNIPKDHDDDICLIDINIKV